jgi:hypothetical protein
MKKNPATILSLFWLIAIVAVFLIGDWEHAKMIAGIQLLIAVASVFYFDRNK